MKHKQAFLLGLLGSFVFQLVHPLRAQQRSEQTTSREFFRQTRSDLNSTIEKMAYPGETLYYSRPLASHPLPPKKREKAYRYEDRYYYHGRSPASIEDRPYRGRTLYLGLDGNKNYYMGSEMFQDDGGLERREVFGKTSP